MAQAPYLIVPKYLSNEGKRNVSQPAWVGSVVGRNYRNGPQLAGRRVLIVKPRNGHPFDPNEHVTDMGPNNPNQPQVILPGFGFADVNELRDLAQAIQERDATQGSNWFDEQRDKRQDINQRVRDYADRCLRASRGHKTFGPTGPSA